MATPSMKDARYKLSVSIILVVFIYLFHVPESRADQNTSIGFQFGWSCVELDVVTDFGLLLDIGMPWVVYADGIHNKEPWSSFLFEAKLGYQYAISDVIKMRVGVRGGIVGSVQERRDNNGRWRFERYWWGAVVLEIGARIETDIGLVIGIELPLLIYFNFGEGDEGFGLVGMLGGPADLLFSQLYIGWVLRF